MTDLVKKKWPPKVNILKSGKKVLISTKSHPQITNLTLFCRFNKYSYCEITEIQYKDFQNTAIRVSFPSDYEMLKQF